MSMKTTIDKIFKKVWSDFHITPEEFELNRKEQQTKYEKYCKDFTDEDRERIKMACELLARLFDSTDRSEIDAISQEYNAEYETLNWSQKSAVAYFRAECLAKKYKDRPCYATREAREGYRQLAKRVRGRY
jgi:hypothetical protein